MNRLNLSPEDKNFYRRWGLGILLGSLILWSLDLVWVFFYPFSPYISDIEIWGFIFCVSVLWIPILLVFIFFLLAENRKILAPFFILPTFFILINFLLMRFYSPAIDQLTENIQSRQIANILHQDNQMVEVIKNFELETGSSPETLDDLIPDYLLAIPETLNGYSVYYGYTFHPEDERWAENEWILEMKFPTGWFKYGFFVYVSDGIYPENYQNFDNWVFLGIP